MDCHNLGHSNSKPNNRENPCVKICNVFLNRNPRATHAALPTSVVGELQHSEPTSKVPFGNVLVITRPIYSKSLWSLMSENCPINF